MVNKDEYITLAFVYHNRVFNFLWDELEKWNRLSVTYNLSNNCAKNTVIRQFLFQLQSNIKWHVS